MRDADQTTPEQQALTPGEARAIAARHLGGPLRMTRMGMIAERISRAFWPVWTILFAVGAILFFGLHESAPLEAVWAVAVIAVLGLGWFLYRGLRLYRTPSKAEAIERLDASMPGRPIQALSDLQAIGASDMGSTAVWNAHVVRMANKTKGARAVEPDLSVAKNDPYALRYVALTALVAGLLFGSIWRATTLDAGNLGPAGEALAAGPTWEGWVEPPAYTGKPSLYLADIPPGELAVPEGSDITLRLYGEVGALTLTETVSGAVIDPAAEPSTETVHSFSVEQNGTVTISGPNGAEWSIVVEQDSVPTVTFADAITRAPTGELQQKFRAQDDFGVTGGTALIDIDMSRIDPRYGLGADPEPRDALVLDLPVTIAGDRTDFEETLIDDLSKHPWANLPVKIQLTVRDALDQTGESTVAEVNLPGRRFFDPLAKTLIEQRRDILWTRHNGARVAQIMRAVLHKPEGLVRDASTYLQVKTVMRRLEASLDKDGALPADTRDELAEAMWEIALSIEEGDLADALERLRRAQDRLSEAIRNGADDEEIAQLMEELRQAMQEYMRQLAQQQNPGQQPPGQQGETRELSQQDLQEMLDKLQELMEQGRTAEAQALLDQLMQMMQNMQVTQGQGQGQQSPGQQAMEGLGETLREQQGLSDEAFRDLQEQFNPNANQGQSGQNQGRNGSQGQGEQHEPGQGQGQQQGQQQGQGQQPGQQQQPGEGGGNGGQAGNLAERQQALRNELNRQLGQLPNIGGEQGEAARRSLGEAGEAMDRAEEQLRSDDLAGAIDSQAQAMEALREGMRNLGEAMAERQQQQGEGSQGENVGQANPDGQRDPLGRDTGTNGQMGTDEQLLQGDDVYRRARDLLDEIRKRSSQKERPAIELEYLERLLDRF